MTQTFLVAMGTRTVFQQKRRCISRLQKDPADKKWQNQVTYSQTSCLNIEGFTKECPRHKNEQRIWQAMSSKRQASVSENFED